MAQKKQQTGKTNAAKKRPFLRKAVKLCISLVLAGLILFTATLAYNNISFSSDKAFARRLDSSIDKALAWTQANKDKILRKKNIALIRMLQEAENTNHTPLFSEIISEFMAAPTRPKCWKRLLDPNWPVDRVELNITIKEQILDNKWVLYAMAPDKAEVTPEELHLFDRRRWQHRKLTHQLDALLVLKNTQGRSEQLDGVIEHLCGRLGSQLVFDAAVVDIYIQKVTFILRAGYPQKIRRRWVERIIANQQPDGGWNDRWFCFTSDTRRPVLGLSTPPSNQHATLQALTALYLVKYRYPQHFGLN